MILQPKCITYLRLYQFIKEFLDQIWIDESDSRKRVKINALNMSEAEWDEVQ